MEGGIEVQPGRVTEDWAEGVKMECAVDRDRLELG